MPSPYSSRGSIDDARALARNLGIKFLEIPITDAFAVFKSQFKEIFKGLPENETEENMQPRLRAMTLMALSNKFGHLLLTTGNKSELAVGYCTIYGDMAGGLAVISDVPKTMVYELARWINRNHEIIPRSTIEKAPSAELKPNQKDQDTLPPYEILDQILQLYVEENLSARDIIARGFDEKTVRWVHRRIQARTGRARIESHKPRLWTWPQNADRATIRRLTDMSAKHALITGSSRGIGRGIALKLADQGVNVAVHYYQNEAAALDTLAQVRERGADGFAVQADVMDPKQITRMFGKVKAEFGKLDIFVGNARPSRAVECRVRFAGKGVPRQRARGSSSHEQRRENPRYHLCSGEPQRRTTTVGWHGCSQGRA